MGKLSVKLKITLWYTGIIIVISAAVLFAMTSISSKLLDREVVVKVNNAVNKMSREVERKFDVREIPGFMYYEQGVHLVLLDNNCNVVGGQIPFGISDTLTCEENGVHTEKHNDNSYYVVDKKVSGFGKTTYWVKGFIPVSVGADTLKSVAKSNAFIMLIMIITAAAGGYIVIGRILTPINRIRQTADKITESNELSQRINLSPGSDEFHQLADSFDKMLDKIEQTVEREKQFTSDASHELRTPVAAILSACEYMTVYASSYDDIKDSAFEVKKEAERMSKLISELLTISRMDKNTLKLSFEAVDISELLDFICDEQQEIHDNGITLHKNIPEGITVNADRYMLARLFINLISNAYSYGVDGGNITVTLTQDNENIYAGVEDDGIGIAPENIPKIWERFYQVDPSRTDNGNMGLGLSMVKWIAECHNGRIDVKSDLGKGSVFTFIMPKI